MGKGKKILVMRTTHMQMYFFLTLLLNALVPTALHFSYFAKIYTVLISWFEKKTTESFGSGLVQNLW